MECYVCGETADAGLVGVGGGWVLFCWERVCLFVWEVERRNEIFTIRDLRRTVEEEGFSLLSWFVSYIYILLYPTGWSVISIYPHKI